MKKQKHIIILLVMSIILTITGCSKGNSSKDNDTTSNKITTGKVEGATYKNDYFGLTLKIPDKWQVQNQDTVNQIEKTGKDMVAGDDKNLNASMDASLKNVLNLLLVSQYPLGSVVSFNPNFVAIAEKVGLFPGIKTGKDYLENSKKLMEKSQIKYDYGKEIYEEKIDGVSFYVMELSVTTGGMTAYQKYYSTIMKKYALNFIVTYSTDEESKSVQQVINTIKISK